MDSGFYAACAGLRAKSQALEIVANNVANLSSTGHRAHQATFRSLIAMSSHADGNAMNRAVNDFGVLGGSRILAQAAWSKPAIRWILRLRETVISLCKAGSRPCTREMAISTYRQRVSF